jgi:hypothetical protein
VRRKLGGCSQGTLVFAGDRSLFAELANRQTKNEPLFAEGVH